MRWHIFINNSSSYQITGELKFSQGIETERSNRKQVKLPIVIEKFLLL
jgi:hypothetical protein